MKKTNLIMRWVMTIGVLVTALSMGCTMHQPGESANAPGAVAATHVASATVMGGEEDSGPRAAALGDDAAVEVREDYPKETATVPPAIASQMMAATERAATISVDGRRNVVSAVEHVVVWGDTLSQIAARYGVSIATLVETNGLRDPDRLEVGQALQLPPAPESYRPAMQIMPDARVVRSAGAKQFDVHHFVNARPGILRTLSGMVPTRGPDGHVVENQLKASEILERVSLDYSVDPRLLLAFLEYGAGLLSEAEVEVERLVYPIITVEQSYGIDRAGLFAQLSWLADTLNGGYYGWKYRGDAIAEFADGERLLYHPQLNAGTVAIQHTLARLGDKEAWLEDVGEDGLYAVYVGLFGDPFRESGETVPMGLSQPPLDLPFARDEVWRFTGGFHGGWGGGSGWSAIDFAPPAEADAVSYCYVSSFPVRAVARGSIARLSDGVIALDLDMDNNEGSGWTVLYLHVTALESLRVGQAVEAGEALGFTSCQGGYSTATHLHIARRFNGEWIPADCPSCPSSAEVIPFVMSGWRVVGLANQQYQGYMLNLGDNRSATAEQGRYTTINHISW